MGTLQLGHGGHGDVNVNVNQNANLNKNIDRSKYQNKVAAGGGGQGKWQHNPEHRKGVSYRDQTTAQKFDRGGSRDAQTREAYRGRAEAGRQDLAGVPPGRAGSAADTASTRDAGSRRERRAGSTVPGLGRHLTEALSEAMNGESDQGGQQPRP